MERQQSERLGIDLPPGGQMLVHLDREAQLRLATVDRIAVAMQRHLIFNPANLARERKGCLEAYSGFA